MAAKPELVTFVLPSGAKVTTTKEQAATLGWSEPAAQPKPKPRSPRTK